MLFAEHIEFYKERGDYVEGMTEINIALAAKELQMMWRLKAQGNNSELYARARQRFFDFEKKISNKLNEYIWLLKGFVQILEGKSSVFLFFSLQLILFGL